MIVITINEPGFAYDVHALVKSFYPRQEVKVLEEHTWEHAQGHAWEHGQEAHSAPGLPEGSIRIDADAIRCRWRLKEREVTQQAWICGQEERVQIKNKLKQLLYLQLSEWTGIRLPWGTLTGIRPVKIAYGMLEEGCPARQIEEHLQKTYFTSPEKIRLSMDIAGRERKILSRTHRKDGYSLYLGIPFCPTTCLYCSFTSYPIRLWEKRVEDYLCTMEKEMAQVREMFQGKILDTVYIGGGTPTTLQPRQLERLLTSLQRYFDFSTVMELTVEAGRADSITPEKLKVLKEMGVNRISVNPQTMQEETLQRIGRKHTVEEVRKSFYLTREAGFDNINMDLILGLPGESKEDVADTMKQIKELSPDSLTVHSLAIKRASALPQWTAVHGWEDMAEPKEAMEIAAEQAAEMGMHPYYLYRQKNISGNLENVGFATPGKEGVYNILMMEELQSIAAMGAGAISKRVYEDGRICRCDNVKEVGLYMERIDEMIRRKRSLFL